MLDGPPQWSVQANSAPADERRRVLKHNDAFAVFDLFGDINIGGLREAGLYKGDTRYLSGLQLLINGVRPMFLNSAVKRNGLLVVELMNPDLDAGGTSIAKGTVHLFRGKLLRDDVCHDHVRVVNFGMEAVQFTLTVLLSADYFDIFQVRGFERNGAGTLLEAEVGRSDILLGYRGKDDVLRQTRIACDPAPGYITGGRCDFPLTLAAGAEAHVYLAIACDRSPESDLESGYRQAFARIEERFARRCGARCSISSSNPLFNLWVDRSTSDLDQLDTLLPEGRYPFAGLPWYATTFGRDGILTAYQCLWFDPGMAQGVLSFLAAHQADALEPARDAEPGKILHEARRGELAALGEVPFGRYYGTVDATPLFIGLAGAYYRRTGDLDFIRGIWPQILRANEWIDTYGDSDGDGFVEYARRSDSGLVQQGWKDSHDSVFDASGRMADAPIALCEVQGYVYDAKRQLARLAALLGELEFAAKVADEAKALRTNFNRAFWCEEIGTYALALDGNKRPCAVATSNAGHALWSGIAEPRLAARVAETLFKPESFCGWGIRTVAAGTPRFNPMAYHNGSVWPHENALIAAGLARYGFTDKAMRIFEGLMQASQHVDEHRMPELFCGFDMRADEGPTLYPVACSPQAWSAAAVIYLLQACLGLRFDPETPEIRFHNARLPEFLDNVEITDLSIGGATIDLFLQRYPTNVGINVVRKQGRVRVVAVK